ncbi:MAG: methyltransferase domain-containing protein [Pyramidobacter sp.]|uniref:tRNA1(Val) (adenine(37)-N6)-methyltransferase n=1 Tax=Pyramidobacter sp. TaxID=1943581 RepID=UPI002A8117F4|nr:methyltransferase domain-containing protein [Pyramidobacter sp.]MDY4033418.1 methyltransferase domain-containing protein [Pyramidobacter sp.]
MELERGKDIPPVDGEAILYGFLRLRQPDVGPRVNMDTVLLAGFARPRAGERVLELGCAHGGVSLILAKRFPQSRFEGLDVQPRLIELARENAARNGLTANALFQTGDLREHRRLYGHQSFDAVVVNPPYEDSGFGRRAEAATNRLARQGEMCSLADVCDAARFLLKNGGRLYMVMRALRLAETLALLRARNLEPRELLMVHPAPGKNASVFLVEARRNGGAAVTVPPPLFIYDEKGEYTPELRRFYAPEPPLP